MKFDAYYANILNSRSRVIYFVAIELILAPLIQISLCTDEGHEHYERHQRIKWVKI
jgi:hypothetical protein